MELFQHVIGGSEVPSIDGQTMPDIDPYTQEQWADVALGGPADADKAVAAARDAFDNGLWPRMGFDKRHKILHAFADLMDEHAHELAMADTRDMGKPITQALHDAARSSWNVRFFADHALMSMADTYPMDSGHHAYSTYGPAGVVVAISPWNFPLMMSSWKVAPALAWGNTVVLKPAEDTPASATIWARLALEAGIPPGVLNVVHGFGPDSVGEALTHHPDVDRITFTGESGTGKIISAAAAANLIPVSLELGGKGANIVFDDAPIDQAVEGIVNGIYFNQGHVCCAGSRLLVQESIAEQTIESLKRRLQTLRLGDPLDKNTDIGAINSREQLNRIIDLTKSGEDEGAERWSPNCEIPEKGFWFAPTVFTGVTQAHRIAREEIFGPVLSVLTFRTPDEAIEKANNTPYGLSAGIWTEKGSRILAMANKVRAGVVWANTFNRFDPASPFGGYKESGFGREGGVQGLGAYLTSEETS